MGTLEGDGIVNYGHNVKITYFAQDQAEKLDINKTIFETVDDIAEGEIRKDLRSILGTFLFSGEEIEKKVSVLSGGERTRLALCQLLLSPCNFLILDEPTNHLDIQSKEVLKQALLNYEGTFIIVSHDREFLDGLTNRIWDIQDKTLKIYHYDVKEYLAKKLHLDEPVLKQTKQVEKTEIQEEKPKTLSHEETKDLKRKRNSIQNNIKKFEEQIASFESKIAEMDIQIAELDYTDTEKSSSILSTYDKLKKDLDNVMSYWELEMEALENLNS